MLSCCNAIFWPCIAITTAVFFKKDCCYRDNCGIWLHHGDLEHCLIKKKKNRCLYVLLPIYMFWYSRFSFRNLKNANSCMSSWCITTRRLFLCTPWSLALAKKSCNNMNNSRAQVSRLCYFFWLWFYWSVLENVDKF